MRTDKSIKDTIRHLDDYNIPETSIIGIAELGELWIYTQNHAVPRDYRVTGFYAAFKYGFICGARWQKRNPAATVARHDGKRTRKP